MRKTPDNHNSRQNRAMRVCRVAYTVNNAQPVRSTIIGDQPLFFMDFDAAVMDTHEDDYMMDADLSALERGVARLHEKILESNHMTQGLPEYAAGDERLELFAAEARFAAAPRMTGESAEFEPVEDILETLGASRMAAEYIEFAKAHGVSLVYSAQIAGASYERDAQQILLNPALPRAERLLLTARELRRVWQHKNGALLHPLTFHPDQAVLVNRAQIADLVQAMLRMAWDLQLAGEKSCWERMEEGAMGDLARAFAREAFADFRTLNNGAAASAVFEAWFLSERCRHEDRHLIQQMLADYQGYVFDSAQPSQAVTAELIAALGTMPSGKNYLAPYVGTIMGDALFTEVRDRSNANFLWFIKFERSFREAEQELQSGMGKDGGASATDRSHKNKRIGDDKNEEAHIITLPHGRGERTGIDQGATGTGGSAQIIAFQRHTAQP